QHSGISAGQPLQPRAEAASQTAVAQEADQPPDGRSRSRRHDADPAQALFQRARPRQAPARGGERQEAARQARGRKETRLGQGEGPLAAGQGIGRFRATAGRAKKSSISTGRCGAAMNQKNLFEVDWSKIPAPIDDGAAAHLVGLKIPPVSLVATDDTSVTLSALRGRSVVFAYPRTGEPGKISLVDDWDMIPGARGCT